MRTNRRREGVRGSFLQVLSFTVSERSAVGFCTVNQSSVFLNVDNPADSVVSTLLCLGI